MHQQVVWFVEFWEGREGQQERFLMCYKGKIEQINGMMFLCWVGGDQEVHLLFFFFSPHQNVGSSKLCRISWIQAMPCVGWLVTGLVGLISDRSLWDLWWTQWF